VYNNGGCAETCSNTLGSFVCSCATGLALAADQRTCNDVNECLSSSICLSSQTCINTYGTYYCVNSALLNEVTGGGGGNAQPEVSDLLGSAATGYTSAMVGIAAMSAAVGAAMLAIVAVLIVRYRQRNRDVMTSRNKPSRFFGTLSSLGFTSMGTSVGSHYSNASDDIDDSAAVATVS
jgi:hypothetical protein